MYAGGALASLAEVIVTSYLWVEVFVRLSGCVYRVSSAIFIEVRSRRCGMAGRRVCVSRGVVY